jgi:hypothetical protein
MLNLRRETSKTPPQLSDTDLWFSDGASQLADHSLTEPAPQNPLSRHNEAKT